MNTSPNTNHVHDATTCVARPTASGFRRHTLAGALLVMGIGAAAVGLAAPSHADDGAPAPAPAPAIVPAPAAPWIPPIATPWIDRFGDSWRVQCGFPGWRGPFQCW